MKVAAKIALAIALTVPGAALATCFDPHTGESFTFDRATAKKTGAAHLQPRPF